MDQIFSLYRNIHKTDFVEVHKIIEILEELTWNLIVMNVN